MSEGFFAEEKKESRVGLYATVIFHLVALIILLASSIGAAVSKETSFILDFTQQEKEEELKKIEELEDFKNRVAAELDAMIAAAPTPVVRNVAVDASQAQAEAYAEGRALQKRLEASRNRAFTSDDDDEVATGEKEGSDNGAEEAEPYTGPSVLSWKLDGRRAVALPIPAYKGLGGGNVVVKIYVNRVGRVIDAKVVSGESSLHRWALDAAKRSKFSRSDTADDPQIGEIVYQFIAQ